MQNQASCLGRPAWFSLLKSSFLSEWAGSPLLTRPARRDHRTPSPASHLPSQLHPTQGKLSSVCPRSSPRLSRCQRTHQLSPLWEAPVPTFSCVSFRRRRCPPSLLISSSFAGAGSRVRLLPSRAVLSARGDRAGGIPDWIFRPAGREIRHMPRLQVFPLLECSIKSPRFLPSFHPIYGFSTIRG